MYVCVLSKSNKQLMPTHPANARCLLKKGLAVIVNYHPFTIQLNYETTNYTQPVTIGVDLGSKHLAVSVTTEKRELYAVQVELRSDIVENLSTRREARRARRQRKIRYRKARFLNRKKRVDWLPPSVQHKVDVTIKTLNTVKRCFPVTKFVIEVAPFDIQRIDNPHIGSEEYQQGPMLSYANVREYVLYRDNHICQYCKKKGLKLQIHHLESRKTGGDAPNNLITLCEDCHEKHHQGLVQLKAKRGVKFNDATQVTIISKRVIDWLTENNIPHEKTYGYITKFNRTNLGLKKTHLNDAFVIAGNFSTIQSKGFIHQKRVRKNNRQLHKFKIPKGGIRRFNKSPKEVFGFRLFDKVVCRNIVGFVFGRRLRGYFDIRTVDGQRIASGCSYKKLKLLEKSATKLTQYTER